MLNNPTRRGFILFVTLASLILVTASAVLLYSMTRDETRIAGNNRRILQAKTAAVSGMNHFKALNMYYEELSRQAEYTDSKRVQIIPETTLGDKTFYKVEVDMCCGLGDKEFFVISTGYYKKQNRIISSHVSRSLFKTVD